MDQRKRIILQAIVDDYISTAEPIGSRTIARKYDLGVSPATIRNEMSDLEMLGYLEQLHTSSGRIPSVKGYRFYVDSLLARQHISEKEIALVESWYQAKVSGIDEVFQETAKILSRMTKNISMVLAPQFSQCTFKYLQFLPLDAQRAIVVIVTDTGFVENKVLDLPEGTSFEDLRQISSSINNRLSGLSFDKIKASLISEIKREVMAGADIFNLAMEVICQSLEGEKNERIYLGGTTQLLNQPEFKSVDKIKALLNMLEEEQLLCDLLHSQAETDGVVVTIGEENKFSGIHECSMVKATYRCGGNVLGSVAVLGPTRMDYGKIISVLEFVQTHLEQVLKKYKV
jgi:heat-inducible transcriptional repressor